MAAFGDLVERDEFVALAPIDRYTGVGHFIGVTLAFGKPAFNLFLVGRTFNEQHRDARTRRNLARLSAIGGSAEGRIDDHAHTIVQTGESLGDQRCVSLLRELLAVDSLTVVRGKPSRRRDA